MSGGRYRVGRVVRPVPDADEGGFRLLTLPRGTDAEVRIVLGAYQGRRFVTFREWARDMDGAWRPLRRPPAVHADELEAVVDVLAAVRAGRVA